MNDDDHTLLCPSAPIERGATILGVFTNSADTPILSHALTRQPLTKAILNELDGADPASHLRLAAPCHKNSCKNFGSDNSCTLVSKVVTWAPSVSSLPRCSIRTECVWWHQEGKEACFRCPTVKSRPAAPLQK